MVKLSKTDLIILKIGISYFGNTVEKTYLSSKENKKTIKGLLVRCRDPDIWKPFIIVLMMFILQIWTGV